ncbi:DNA-binding protein [Muribacter muris]|uniref:DNA-binding protein n=1 Tax=Muribacter muris TaxID=67855 RepID=UPI001F4CECB4|nr:DNA-binding protein [Muribacter muris]
MWVELKDILGVGGLPTTVQGVTKKAKLENWERRRKAGVRGNVFEYHLHSLPLKPNKRSGYVPHWKLSRLLKCPNKNRILSWLVSSTRQAIKRGIKQKLKWKFAYNLNSALTKIFH